MQNLHLHTNNLFYFKGAQLESSSEGRHPPRWACNRTSEKVPVFLSDPSQTGTGPSAAGYGRGHQPD